jgi:signal peptide peptidase SppA
LLDVDSPGGEAIGAFEVADVVREAAQEKQVVAVVNGLMASAAYAIGSAASRIVTTSSGVSGSIGVVMLHADYSHALHERGVKPTLIHAGARKVDGNPYQPLTDDVKAELKAEVDKFYDLFVSGVARGRKRMTEKSVRETQARTFIGIDAVDAGLADSVGSFESVLADLTAKAPPPTPRSSTKRDDLFGVRPATASPPSPPVASATAEPVVAAPSSPTPPPALSTPNVDQRNNRMTANEHQQSLSHGWADVIAETNASVARQTWPFENEGPSPTEPRSSISSHGTKLLPSWIEVVDKINAENRHRK